MISSARAFPVRRGTPAVSTIAVVVLTLGLLLVGCSKDAGSDPASTATTDQSETTATMDVAPSDSATSSDTRAADADDTHDVENGNAEPGGTGAAETFAKFPALGELTTQIDAPDEFEACKIAHERLSTYKSIADDAAISDLQTLHDSLNEFEENLYLAAEQQDWGDRMIENLINVRRLWATAASNFDDAEAAASYSTEAMKFLEAALAVDCPR